MSSPNPSPFSLRGKVALITGGNGGIGLAMAEALAGAGADLIIWGSNTDKNIEAERALVTSGVRVLIERVDVREETEVVSGIARAVSAMGRIDTVVISAAVTGKSTPLVDITAKELRDVFDVNVNGSFFTLRESCRHMVDRSKAGDPGGSLILVGSAVTESGLPRFAPYVGSKGVLAPLMRSIVVEYARHGIRANLVQPGFIRTDMTGHFRDSKKVEDWILSTVPQRRWGEASEFGGIAVFLASDASSYQNGSTIAIDGGFLAT